MHQYTYGKKTLCQNTFLIAFLRMPISSRRWRTLIKVRKYSQHAQCKVCSDYSQYIHYSRASPEDKQASVKRWHTHLTDQYCDRLIYWNIRFWSRRPESNILSIIIDSMD